MKCCEGTDTVNKLKQMTYVLFKEKINIIIIIIIIIIIGKISRVKNFTLVTCLIRFNSRQVKFNQIKLDLTHARLDLTHAYL